MQLLPKQFVVSLVAMIALLPVAGLAEQSTEKAINFEEHIKPILRRYCLKCHGNDEQNADLNMQSYGTLMKGGSAGVVVKPGRPGASVLYQAITAEDDAARMPPESPPLPKEHIDLIGKWIAMGLRDRADSKSLASSATVTFNPKANASMKPTGPPPMPVDLPEVARHETVRPLPVVAMAASPWAPLLAVASYEHVRLVNISTQQEIGVLPFPEGIPHVLRFSRNGAVLLAAGGRPVQSGTVVLFDVRTGKRLAKLGDELDAVMAADISPDQRLIVLGGSGRVVKAYSTEDGSLRYQLARHTNWITALAFSPDGKQLASADRAGGIHLWDAESGGILLSLSQHKAAVRTLAWRSDSQLLASGSEDGRLTWWNTTDGFVSVSHANPHPPQRPSGSYGRIPNGVLVASFGPSGELITGGRDKHARLWDASGKQLKSFPIDSAPPTQVAISHDGKTLIAGDSAGKVHFWQRSE